MFEVCRDYFDGVGDDVVAGLVLLIINNKIIHPQIQTNKKLAPIMKPATHIQTSPYLVATPQGYTKHYYAGSERLLSKIGDGKIYNHSQNPEWDLSLKLNCKKMLNNKIIFYLCRKFKNIKSKTIVLTVEDCYMENKTIKIILFIISVIFLLESCTWKRCLKMDTHTQTKYLDALPLYCDFLKQSPDKKTYLINPMDSNIVCDIDTLFYYKENNSRHILVFSSWIMEKYYIAVVQEEKLDLLQCGDLFKICEIGYPNKLVIEVYDSLLQFNTLSYGLHRLELRNNEKSVLYHYTDTIMYNCTPPIKLDNNK